MNAPAYLRSLTLLAIACMPLSTHGQSPGAPDSLSFQGMLTDALGNPVDSTGVNMTFKLYKAATEVWTETQSVDVVDGIYNVYLGRVTPLDTVAFNAPIDLGVKIDGEPSEMTPRTPLAAAAYARAMPGMYTFARVVISSESYNVVGGGSNNVIGPGATGATISGGGGNYFGESGSNQVLERFGTVGGGAKNTAGGREATVGGGVGNSASSRQSTIAGGDRNTASSSGATVSGGRTNTASGGASTISGGFLNRAAGTSSTVAGGGQNIADTSFSSVGGGIFNRAVGVSSTIPGGEENRTAGRASFAAGFRAKAMHAGAFVWNDRSVTNGDTLASTAENQFLVRAAGGVGIGTNAPSNQLTVSGDADVTGKLGVGTAGPNNALTVSGDADVTGRLGVGDTAPRAMVTVRGPDSATDGPIMFMYGDGSDQAESGRIRFVEGTASNNNRGAYIHYDGAANRLHIGTHNTGDATPANDVNAMTFNRANQFIGLGGVDPAHPLHVGTGATNGNGAHLTIGGSWTNGSSRAFKENLRPVDGKRVLEDVVGLPLYRWRYKGSDEGDHMGPVAEDFFDAFELGQDERYISTVDGDGVALAAIQGMYELIRKQQAEIERMRAAMERAGIE